MPGTNFERIKIDLKSPVEVAGVKVDALVMREPKVRDLLAADKVTKGDVAREIWLYASLCEVEPAVIEDLSVKDYAQVQRAYQGFLS